MGIIVVEMSLHLLRAHLIALSAAIGLGGAVAAAGAAPASGAPSPPRLALTVQYLRALRQFAGSARGGVAPVDEALARNRLSGSAATTQAPAKVADLTFAACIAEQVEGLLAET